MMLSPIKTTSQVRAINKSDKPLYYMEQLDALRALAVFEVMFLHFSAGLYSIHLHWGDWGVHLFFVLSGFLITGILLGCRDLRQSSPQARPLQQFYIRRSLRILPLFYLVVVGAALVNIHPARETLPWNLTYTSNFYFARLGHWNGPVTHFWSLAVEEQFYLIWPFLIFYIPRNYTGVCIMSAIILAPIYQIVGYYLGLNKLALTIVTIPCLNYLGAGALLALWRYQNAAGYESLARNARYNLAGIPLLLAMIGASYLIANSPFNLVVNGAATALFFVWLIHCASVGFGGPLGALLRWKPLLFVGSISYGIYIYHNFMPIIAPRLFKAAHIQWPENIYFQIGIYMILSIVVATFSWFCFERPINAFKRHFRYQND